MGNFRKHKNEHCRDLPVDLADVRVVFHLVRAAGLGSSNGALVTQHNVQRVLGCDHSCTVKTPSEYWANSHTTPESARFDPLHLQLPWLFAK